MDNEALIPLLQIVRTPGIGPVTYKKLLKLYKTPQSILKNYRPLTRSETPYEFQTISNIKEELEAHADFGAYLIHLENPFYPPLLREIVDAPPVLSVKGKVELFHCALIGIVGSRNGSFNGGRMARALAADLGLEGWGIVSGLARGIDTAAHEGSLATGTVAVLANGIDHIYPPENRALYQEISEEGLLVSESPFGTAPQASLFPRRNRLIAGMSHGVVVVEAAIQSGSLHTARYAMDYGREVLAVPGSPLDPRCRGSNALLKDGASLVESVHDILEALGSTSHQKKRDLPVGGGCSKQAAGPSSALEIEKKILEVLSAVPTCSEHLFAQMGIAGPRLSALLLELEIQGKILRMAGNLYVKA